MFTTSVDSRNHVIKVVVTDIYFYFRFCLLTYIRSGLVGQKHVPNKVKHLSRWNVAACSPDLKDVLVYIRSPDTS